jgi:Tol biopolymer transport system component
MNASNGTKKKNLTNNGLDAYDSLFYAQVTPDGQGLLYTSQGAQASNPEGDQELYLMNASDGSGKKNLSNNGGGVDEFYGVFSPDGQKLLYQSDGAQASNPEGESDKKNLTNNTVRDFYPEWGR